MIYSFDDFIVNYLVGAAITLVVYLTFDFVFFASLAYIWLKLIVKKYRLRNIIALDMQSVIKESEIERKRELCGNVALIYFDYCIELIVLCVYVYMVNSKRALMII